MIQESGPITQAVPQFLQNMKEKIDLRYVRMDNAGENKVLENELISMGIDVEYTAPHMPQHKGVTERAISTSISRTSAMMTQAGLSTSMNKTLWGEGMSTAVVVISILTKNEGGTP
jgi:hypothetical protein